MKGLILNIYRHATGECSLNVFNDHDTVLLVDKAIDEIFSSDEQCPPVGVCKKPSGYIYAVPMGKDGELKTGGMFGGSFIWSCDSRVRAVSSQPIPLHDRFE